MGRAILFAHPGVEHVPKKGQHRYGWNTGNHARKFLLSHARVAEPHGSAHELGPRFRDVAFWGEWEGASDCGLFAASENDLLPRAWHRPLPPVNPPAHAQNTDPWVYGQAMRYALCRQTRHQVLRELQRGDVIFFGSVKQRTSAGARCPLFNFFLDTVFVVASRHPYNAAQRESIPVDIRRDDSYRLAVLDRIDPALGNMVLYEGSMLSNATGDLFSWVPCMARGNPAGGRFPRPMINDLFDIRITNPRMQIEELLVPADAAWRAAAERVAGCGLEMAAEIALTR